MLKLLTRLVYGGSSTLRDYERACLLKVISALDGQRGQTLQKQIEEIELVQRFSEDKLVAVHFLKKKGSLPILPDKGDEVELARIEVDPKNWTGGMVKSKTNPVPCRRNVVCIVPSSKPRSGSKP